MGSVSELENQLLLARDLDFLRRSISERFVRQGTEVNWRLTSFIQKLNADR